MHVVWHSEDLLRSYKRRKDFRTRFESVLLNNALLALGKVPGPVAESVSREEACFSRVTRQRSFIAELDEGRTFLSKQSYARWHLWPMFNSTGLTLTVSTFFQVWESQWSTVKNLHLRYLFGISDLSYGRVATWVTENQNFTGSAFAILLNLFQSWPSLFLFGLLILQ